MRNQRTDFPVLACAVSYMNGEYRASIGARPARAILLRSEQAEGFAGFAAENAPTEGGIVQGIGHTLMENVTYDPSGRPAESSFMQYKVPTRLDMGRLKVEFEHSYEPTGPFGAKSIGEIVINTPGPAIAHAIYRATGKWFRELPITPEQIAMSQIEE